MTHCHDDRCLCQHGELLNRERARIEAMPHGGARNREALLWRFYDLMKINLWYCDRSEFPAEFQIHDGDGWLTINEKLYSLLWRLSSRRPADVAPVPRHAAPGLHGDGLAGPEQADGTDEAERPAGVAGESGVAA